MNKATKVALVTEFAFILASILLSNGKYLLVKVEKQREFDSSTPVAQLHARQAHEQCYKCIEMFCRKKMNPAYVIDFRNQCEKFKNEINFPSKKWLVNCGNMICINAKLEIQEFCVEGTTSSDPEIHALRKSCHEE